MQPKRILVVDDEKSITSALELVFGDEGYEVKTAGSVAEAVGLMGGGRPFDLVFTDLRLPDATGIELLDRIKADAPDTQVVLITAHGTLDTVIDAIKRGAYYYVEKPFTPEQVLMLAARALQFGEIRRENKALRQALAPEGEAFGITGRDPRMCRIIETIRTAAPRTPRSSSRARAGRARSWSPARSTRRATARPAHTYASTAQRSRRS